MSQRLLDPTKWLWCALVLYVGPMWSPVGTAKVRTPPNNPGVIEAQAKFFQYRHLPTSEDYDQGHRLGSERHFTERHERSRPSEGLFSAKVRWGDKQGGYGEHYWDLNHAGHAGNHGDDKYGSDSDDGSYHEHGHNNDDPYDEPSEQSPSYDNDDYDAEKAAQYDESNRSKRAHQKAEQKNNDDEQIKYGRKTKEQPAKEETEEVEYKKPAKIKRQRQKEQHHVDIEQKENKEIDTREQPSQYVTRRQPEHYVPYESGAGVRQYQTPEVTAASTPRLFLEPSTGHVVDRATGQAYVLQPINYA